MNILFCCKLKRVAPRIPIDHAHTVKKEHHQLLPFSRLAPSPSKLEAKVCTLSHRSKPVRKRKWKTRRLLPFDRVTQPLFCLPSRDPLPLPLPFAAAALSATVAARYFLLSVQLKAEDTSVQASIPTTYFPLTMRCPTCQRQAPRLLALWSAPPLSRYKSRPPFRLHASHCSLPLRLHTDLGFLC